MQQFKQEISNCHYQTDTIQTWKEDTEWGLKIEHQQSLGPPDSFTLKDLQILGETSNWKIEQQTQFQKLHKTSHMIQIHTYSRNCCIEKKISFKTSTVDSHFLWTQVWPLTSLEDCTRNHISPVPRSAFNFDFKSHRQLQVQSKNLNIKPNPEDLTYIRMNQKLRWP